MPQTGIGALIGWGLGAYGKKPKVPALAEISPEATQTSTVQGNIASFSDIAKLATNVNAFNQDQLSAIMEKQLPGGAGKIRDMLSSQLSGEIPEDVSRAVQRAGAERGVSGGFAGSQFGRNLTARDLGLTSLGIMNQGFNSALNWIQATRAPTFDVTSMFFTPQQRLAFEQQQQSIKFERDLMAAGVKAAPDPWRVALAQGFDNDIKTMSNAALSYAGMAAGGMGGMGGGAAPSAGGGGFGGAGFGYGFGP